MTLDSLERESEQGERLIRFADAKKNLVVIGPAKILGKKAYIGYVSDATVFLSYKGISRTIPRHFLWGICKQGRAYVV